MRAQARPVLLFVLGVALFSAMDAAMKELVAVRGHPALAATFWRYVAALPVILLFWWRAGRPAVRASGLPLHILRGAVIAASAVLFFRALAVLPLAEAVALAFVAPLMIPPLAALLLRERLAPASLAAGSAGFLGVAVATGLDPAEIPSERRLGIAAVLASAFLYALAIVLTRRLAPRDGPSVVSLLGAVVPALVLLPPLLLTVPGPARLPPAGDAGLVLAAGLFGAVALQLIARAFAQAEAQRLAPFEYTALLWAALFGFALFSEPLTGRTAAGAAIIAAACLWQARRAAAAPAPSLPVA